MVQITRSETQALFLSFGCDSIPEGLLYIGNYFTENYKDCEILSISLEDGHDSIFKHFIFVNFWRKQK